MVFTALTKSRSELIVRAKHAAGSFGGGLVWLRAPKVLGECFKVLHNGREMELVARAGEATSSKRVSLARPE